MTVVSDGLMAISIAITVVSDTNQAAPAFVDLNTPSLVAAKIVCVCIGLIAIFSTAVTCGKVHVSPVWTQLVPPSVDFRIPMPYDDRAPGVPTCGRW